MAAEDGDRESGGSGSKRPGARYSTFVGIAFLALIAIATLNTIRTDEGSILGTDPVRGRPLPEFAVPDIRGPLDLDANIAQDDCETSENPCPQDAQRTPACRIEPKDAIRVCDLFDRPLVISFWFTDPGGCPPTQDVVDRVARRFRGRVNFLSLAVRGDRDEVAGIVEERGWSIPVGWDRDGAVSNVYHVGVCPTLAFAFPGGIFQSAHVEGADLTSGRLVAEVEHLIRESRRRDGARG